jgi:hypothetical protein
MIAFASRTGTRRNLAALRGAGWGLFISAAGVWRDEGFDLVAGDNGAWTDHQQGLAFNEERFARFVEWFGARPKLLILPDIVLGGGASLSLSLRWLSQLAGHPAKLLIAVQNGMEPGEIAPHLSPRVGIAIGGDTPWKLATMPTWSALARAHGAHCHVLRVNTERRIRLCHASAVDSFDGSSASRFSVTLRPLELARQQTDLEGYLLKVAA